MDALPVVMMTSSIAPSDMEKARRMGADDYRIKPAEFEKLVQIMQELNQRWLVKKTDAPSFPKGG
ncbi:MAG TPA: hypothetical protein VGN61_09450 [Verrucomicrobiae bacterium]